MGQKNKHDNKSKQTIYIFIVSDTEKAKYI